MWIIPKNLHISRFVPGTEALISDLDELSAMCEQSLFQRSKPSLARTWLQRWRRASWSPHLFGRILKHSHGDGFEERWTSSLEASLVNPLAPPVSAPEPKTRATSSPSSSRGLDYADLPLFSWRMSRESYQADLRATIGVTPKERPFCCTSLENWKGWVIKRRREYSARLKSERLIKGKECSLWQRKEMLISGSKGIQTQYATPQVEDKSGTDGNPREHYQGKYRGKLNPRWVETLMGLPIGWTMPSCAEPVIIVLTSSDSLGMELSPTPQREPSASCGETWPTPPASQRGEDLTAYLRKCIKRMKAGGAPFAPTLQVATEAPAVSTDFFKDLDLMRETEDLILEIKQAMNK